MSPETAQQSANRTVRVDRGDDGVATLWVDRPPLNILDLDTLAALGSAATALAAEPPRVLVVRGAGRCFSAGVAVEDHTPDKIGLMLERFHGALEGLRKLPSVTVAAVHGHCLGGGMELAAACDLAIAGDDARFGQPEVKLGCYPPYAAALYPSLLGPRVTLDLLLTGRTIDAAEALRFGFVSRVVPAGDLDAAVEEIAGALGGLSAEVARLTKKAVAAGTSQGAADLAAALAECERIYLEELAETADMEEGIAAFLDKRRAEWRHR